jgi:hypothetical protein
LGGVQSESGKGPYALIIVVRFREDEDGVMEGFLEEKTRKREGKSELNYKSMI